MTKTLSILVTILLLPSGVFAQQQVQQQQTQEQVTLEVLQNRYEQQQRTATATQADPESEVRRLRSQIIDLRVERDSLQEENLYLKNRLENVEAFEESRCIRMECVPLADVENERILSYVIYSLSLYRMAEVVVNSTPVSDVEAHKKAQRVMAGVKSDLDTLGFDTTDMQDYPQLDELLEEMQIANKMR